MMRRLALIGALTSSLLVGGCAAVALGGMWMAAYESNKGQEPMTVEPAAVDPVQDGRLYRNKFGTTLQIVNGQLRLQSRCYTLRGKLRSTGRDSNGPRVPVYRFALTEKVARIPVCQKVVEELTGLEVKTYRPTAEWLRKFSPADLQNPGWTIMVTELSGSARGGSDELTFDYNETTIEDPR